MACAGLDEDVSVYNSLWNVKEPSYVVIVSGTVVSSSRSSRYQEVSRLSC